MSEPGFGLARKPCSKCRVVKPLEMFYRDARRPDKTQSWCARCSNIRQLEQRHGKPIDQIVVRPQKRRMRYLDQASVQEARGADVIPIQRIPHQVFCRYPYRPGALVEQLLRPMFRVTR